MKNGGLRLAEASRRAGDRVEAWIEDRPAAAGIAAAIFLAVGLVGASRKEMWFDEVFTFALTRLGSAGAIQDALAGGADGNRIGFYVVNLVSARLFGLGPLAIRLPAVLGFVTFAVCLGIFTARRCGTLAGWMAATIPYLMGTRLYVFEGRQYGLVLGFTGAALLGWQAAGDGRRGGRVALALALLLGSFVSPLMAFSILAIAGGETWRTAASSGTRAPGSPDPLRAGFLSGRIDWFFWFVVGAAGSVILLSQRVSSQGSERLLNCGRDFVDKPVVPALLQTYGWLFGLWPLVYKLSFVVFACFALMIWVAVVPRLRPGPGRGETSRSAARGFRAHEIATAVLLALTPFVVYGTMRVAHWAYVPRYSIAAAAGIALLSAAPFPRLRANGKGGPAVVFLVLLALSAHLRQVALSGREPSGAVEAAALTEAVSPGERRVVVTNSFDYLRYTFYAPAEMQARMRMLYDVDAGLSGSQGSGDLFCVFGLQPYWPVKLEPYHEFIGAGEPFYVVSPVGADGWILSRLSGEGFRISNHGAVGGATVYSVERGGPR